MNAQWVVSCTFITRTEDGVDADGNNVYTDSATVVGGCLFAPGGSVETLGNQDTVITQPTLYLPSGVVVPSPVDAVTVPGQGTFEVDGQPQVWPMNPTNFTTVVKLKGGTG